MEYELSVLDLMNRITPGRYDAICRAEMAHYDEYLRRGGRDAPVKARLLSNLYTLEGRCDTHIFYGRLEDPLRKIVLVA